MSLLHGGLHRLLPHVGANPETLNQLVRDVHSIPNLKLRDMILFAIKCSRNPQSLAEADFANLRQHGLKESEILEIIWMSALAVYANIMADATAMDDDEMFNRISPLSASLTH